MQINLGTSQFPVYDDAWFSGSFCPSVALSLPPTWDTDGPIFQDVSQVPTRGGLKERPCGLLEEANTQWKTHPADPLEPHWQQWPWVWVMPQDSQQFGNNTGPTTDKTWNQFIGRCRETLFDTIASCNLRVKNGREAKLPS